MSERDDGGPLRDLIARVEKATEGSRELDLAVAQYLFPGKFISGTLVDGPFHDYSQSLDAAMLTVPHPLGSMSLATTFAVGGFADGRKHSAWAKVYYSTAMAGAPYDPPPFEAKDCASPALALLAASLKARNLQE